MGKSKKEKTIRGMPISEGVAIGRLHFLPEIQDGEIPSFPIQHSEVDEEISRFHKALISSRKDLHHIQNHLACEGSSEAVTIIDAHIQMLDDPVMTTLVEKKIRQSLKNTEFVFDTVMKDYEKQFTEKDFLKERLLDVKDLSSRILKHLAPQSESDSYMVPDRAIIYTNELIPSGAAESSSHTIGGFIAKVGGKMSHSALIARAKGIPFISNIDFDSLDEGIGKIVIIDGTEGILILNPSGETLKYYEKVQTKLKNQYTRLTSEGSLSSETKDGYKIDVLANVETLEDFKYFHEYGAAGVGLFRSEFLFLKYKVQALTEKEQYTYYKKLLTEAKGLPVVFRVFDIGGDKNLQNLSIEKDEMNPALGCRAIRFLLNNVDIFKKQLKALYKAHENQELILLLPLISDVEEILETKRLLKHIENEFIHNQWDLPTKVKIGAMIEVPSAVITCDIIAQECDFLSIGTNDLVQYTLAADRTNQEVSGVYKPTHPSIVRMIARVAEEGKKQNIPIALCGEIASNPLFTPLLVGLGITQLSCSPRYIPIIKSMIRRISLEEAKKFVGKILKLSYGDAIHDALIQEYKRYAPDHFS